MSPRPLTGAGVQELVVHERVLINIADLETDRRVADYSRAFYRRFRLRSGLWVPMLRDTEVIGIVIVWHTEPSAFGPRHEELLKTFADQAVIAIENVRLFNETKEALEQQTATSEILRVISSSPTDVQPVFDTIVQNAGRVCDSMDAALVLADGAEMVVAAHWGPIAGPPGTRFALTSEQVMGRAILEARAVHVEDLSVRPDFPEGQALAIQMGHRTTLAVPLLLESRAIGSLLIRRMEVRPFTDKQIALLQTFADQAVIAIENVRLFTELQASNRDLSETLQQQTATSDVLGVISRSPGQLEPVFQVMLANAVRICEAKFGAMYLSEEESIFRIVAMHNAPPAFAEMRRHNPVFRASPRIALARAAATKRTVQIADVQAEPGYFDPLPGFSTSQIGMLAGARTVVAVPMIKESELMGVIAIYRQEVSPFTDKQIGLVQNFASQAVIAIENTRLLNELRESLQQQTATADVLKVISRSTFDLQAVLNTLVESAAQLCEADRAVIGRPQGATYYIEASYGLSPQFAEFVANHPAEIDGS